MNNHRMYRSILSAAALAVLLVAVPLALLACGRSPLDGTGSLWQQLRHLPTQPVSDHVAFGMLTIAAWIGWALFTISVAVEAAAALGVAARWHVPVPGPIQLGARKLVMSLLTGLTLVSPLSHRAGAVPALPTTFASEATMVEPTPALLPAHARTAEAPAGPAGAPVALAAPPTAPAEPDTLPIVRHQDSEPASPAAADTATQPVITVASGDTPWGLAERHLANGLRWHDIWDLNHGVTQPDGRAWVTPDLILVGWTLRLPADATDLPNQPSSTTVAPDQPPSTGTAPAPDPDKDTPPAATDQAPENAAPSDRVDIDDAERSGPPAREADQRTPLNTTNSDRPDDGTEPAASDDDTGEPVPLTTLAGATVLATGIVLALQRMRRRRAARGTQGLQRHRGWHSRRTEQSFLRAADVPLVRWAGQALADLVRRLDPSQVAGAAPVAVELSEDYGIELLWDQPAPDAPGPWIATGQGWSWQLSYDPDAPVPPDDYPCPIPALVTIGHRNDRTLMVDLEAFGPLAITGDPERVAEFGLSVGLELGANDDLADAYISTVGFGLGTDDHLRRITETTLHDAVNRLHATADSVNTTLNELGMASTFDYRTVDPNNYLEAVIMMATSPDNGAAQLAAITPPRRGVGTILLDPGHLSGTEARIHIAADGHARLEPLGVEFHAAALDADTARDLTSMLSAEASATEDNGHRAPDARTPFGPLPEPTVETAAPQLRLIAPPTSPDGPAPSSEDEAPVGADHLAVDVADLDVAVAVATAPDRTQVALHEPGDDDARTSDSPAADGCEVATDSTNSNLDDTSADGRQDLDDALAGRLLVRVLGKPSVPDRPGIRRRAVILTVFLACRGEPVPADAMRHAVWNGRSRTDKTVWNLVAEARSALGTFDDGEPIVPPANKTNNSLQISDRVVTDLALLRQWHRQAQEQPSSEAIVLLTRALDLVQGEPFAGAGYEWAHEAQHAIEAATLIEDAALQLVELATQTDQPDVARTAIANGLRALPGNEPLYRARMQLEHDLGNNAGVQATWHELVNILDELGTDPADATTTLYNQLMYTRIS